MKISEMTNDQATEAIVRMATPISNLCNDDEFANIMDELSKADKGMSVVMAVSQYMPRIVTFALKKHKQNLYEIVGALTAQGPDKVKKMNFFDTIKVLKENWGDISDFFLSSRDVTKKIAEE